MIAAFQQRAKPSNQQTVAKSGTYGGADRDEEQPNTNPSGTPTPSQTTSLLPRTAAASRNLAGYEVYRFGTNELQDDDQARPLVTAFFDSLLRRHHVAVPK